MILVLLPTMTTWWQVTSRQLAGAISSPIAFARSTQLARLHSKAILSATGH